MNINDIDFGYYKIGVNVISLDSKEKAFLFKEEIVAKIVKDFAEQ